MRTSCPTQSPATATAPPLVAPKTTKCFGMGQLLSLDQCFVKLQVATH